MSKFELKDHPSISYGNHIDDRELVVMRVNDGDYTGTVFSFSNVKGFEDDGNELTYSVDFQVFQYKGEYYESTPAQEILNTFYDTVTSPMLHNIIVNVAETAE